MLIGLTGANGFLGRHILQQAIEAGHKVVALVRSEKKLIEYKNNAQVRIAELDYSSQKSIAQTIQKASSLHGPFDLFIHNAGLTNSIDRSAFFKINRDLTALVSSAVEEINCIKDDGRFVYISSLAAGGPVGFNRPASAYGESKLAAEKIIQSSDLEYNIIRPTGIYGLGDQAFLPMFKTASKGLFFDLAKKNQRLTLINAKDLASQILMIKSVGKNLIIPMANPEVYSQKDLARTFSVVLNKKVKYIRLHPGIAKVALSISDTIHKAINKTPEVTLEKYNEISQDWDLEELKHNYFKSYQSMSLAEGFELTLRAYKQESLI